MRILAGVPAVGGGVKWEWGGLRRQFLAIWVATSSEIPIVCAIADIGTTDYDVILPADVVKKLQAVGVSVVPLRILPKG